MNAKIKKLLELQHKRNKAMSFLTSYEVLLAELPADAWHGDVDELQNLIKEFTDLSAIQTADIYTLLNEGWAK